MKRLKSSDDISSYGDKGPNKDWGRKEDGNLHRSLSNRNVYYKSDNGKKGLSSSSSRYDRLDDDRENLRSVRKRTDYDGESYDRRKVYDRYRDGGERGIVSSPRGGYNGDRIHRSESFSVPRREFPKGFRSERDRSRREGSVSSWRRFGGVKDVDENGSRGGHEFARGSRVTSDETGRVKSPGGSLGEMGRPNSWQSVRTADHPQGLRDTKSPSCSRTARSPSCSRTARSPSCSRTARSPSCSKNAKSSSCSKNAKSPPRSKDSGSEQSKSIEVKKNEDLPIESGNNSEMEEGELEPDPEPVPVVKQLEEEAANGLKPNPEEFSNNNLVKAKSLGERDLLPEAKQQPGHGIVHKEKSETQVSEATHNVVKIVDKLSGSPKTSVYETSKDEVANATTEVVKVANDQQCFLENSMSAEKASDTVKESCPSNYEQKDNKSIDLEVKTENIDLPGLIEGTGDKNVTSKVVLSLLEDRIDQSVKDKGKGLAIVPSSDCTEDVIRAEAETFTEGPSPRGFQLFFVDPVKKASIAEKSSSSKLKDEQIATEPLELSLSLPSVLYANNSQNTVQAASSQNTVQAPSSPSHARSVQSFASSLRTSSDAYTASLSFSGSQTFTHNPSCSLTNNSYDNCEKSVGSRPIFKGLDQVTPVAWQGQSSNETENKENPMYQRILSNGNGLAHHSQMSQDIIIGRVVQLPHQADEGSSKLPRGLDRQLSHNKQLAGVQLMHPTEVRSPTQSIVSHGTGPDYWNERRHGSRDKVAGDVQEEKQSFPGSGADFMEPIISMIVSEPIHTAARKFNEMTRQAASRLKESVRDVILNPGKRSKLLDLQKALARRSDITLEILLQSHRAQLEVLVALKTGLQDFLQQNYEISSSDLAEIFLNLRCRNLTCRSQLPVDECDCRICVPKDGFCSACMCLVCSKFDMASNTCSWVGCDVCLHWCHADCGLRELYIRNGDSASGAQGTTEMQFHCVACRHPSEMFGFVKEVFQNFAKEWTAETLSKELHYVRKIFRASEDVRGRQMHELATQMLTRLANKSDVQEVRSCIMALLARNDSSKSSSLIVPGNETIKKKQEEGTSIIAGSSQEPTWLKAVYADKAPQLERSVSLLPSFDFEMNDKNVANSDLLRHTKKEPGFDELESIVRIKQAEANMFQSRADDARREAEGLKRIANAKNEKIEEEYTSRIRKLQLIEAEEIRRKKFVELQALEREHQEYFNMKTRMKTEIKDLLLKMEATKCNFTL
ncbi:protein OBERON 4 [Apium graveolens]|uniref:protein OBERON 4 n=1 Tax=Apium graveolens TaxID=4045 RepID=UPI003D7AA41F